MGWIFLFAVAFMMVYLVLKSRRTRLIAAGVFAFIAAVVAIYLSLLDEAEHQPVPPAADEKLKDTRQLAEKAALARRAISPNEVALSNISFAPASEEIRKTDGTLSKYENLFSWVFSGSVSNLNQKYAVQDIIFRARLFSCPDFVTGNLELADLEIRCNMIGDRRFGLYDTGIQPGTSYTFSESVTFDNQPQPGNWRYWIDTSSVTARID